MNIQNLLFSSIGGMAMAMAYGLAIRKRDDPYIKVAEEAAQSIIEATKPAALVLKLMPFLKHIPSWIPGTDSLKRIRYCNTLQERFHNVPFQAAVNSVVGFSFSRVNKTNTVGGIYR